MLQKYCYKSLSEMETTQPLEMNKTESILSRGKRISRGKYYYNLSD